ncbi:hypothetical protein [Pseudomonas sp. SO81]|uniref:hypothetical protein n=1 Tax=Pseudomonas sp. SO81 TaxID=2983246 RepID=UPI0025A47F06|nr:hypothetical protein [Pseudomonas sp. SO81]WJN57554.1 hypothetical protein OH686_02325 [Pseudomonas sp. SO81]
MTPDEIKSLIAEQEEYNLPETIIKRELMLALVESGDPMFLLNVPEPFRSKIIDFGLAVTDQWYEISNNGTVDFSEHVGQLKKLVEEFLAEVPVGNHINWGSANT